MTISSLSSFIEVARRQAGLTQRDLARRAGTPQSAIARIESGRANPTVTTVQRLLDATGYALQLQLVSVPPPDPVVERYKLDVDRTLLRENLKKTPDKRRNPTRRTRREAYQVIGLRQLLGALHNEGVKCIVVGGVAARAHGSARVTQDIDLSYERDDDNLRAIYQALRKFKPYLRGAPPGLPFEWSERTLRAGLNFTLTTTAGDIDLLGEIIGGGRYEDLEPHTVRVEIFGHETMLLDIDWLIRVKRAAGRPKDLEVVAELEALREERGATAETAHKGFGT